MQVHSCHSAYLVDLMTAHGKSAKQVLCIVSFSTRMLLSGNNVLCICVCVHVCKVVPQAVREKVGDSREYGALCGLCFCSIRLSQHSDHLEMPSISQQHGISVTA